MASARKFTRFFEKKLSKAFHKYCCVTVSLVAFGTDNPTGADTFVTVSVFCFVEKGFT